MSIENDLLQLARQRESLTDAALLAIPVDRPDFLLRQIRAYLARQADLGRMKHTNEKIVQLHTVQGGLNQLRCAEIRFSSGTRVNFDIELEPSQTSWLVKRFRFHVRLAQPRNIKMVRVHLNQDTSHDPVTVPRCHMHIDDSEAHVPFPVMDPRLILHIICDQVEIDFGGDPSARL